MGEKGTVGMAMILIGSALAGLVGFGIFFSDGAGGVGSRLAVSAVLLALCGTAVGYLRPSAWAALSGLTAWGTIVLGLMGVAMGQDHASLILLLPLCAALAGGYGGARWKRRAAPA